MARFSFRTVVETIQDLNIRVTSIDSTKRKFIIKIRDRVSIRGRKGKFSLAWGLVAQESY